MQDVRSGPARPSRTVPWTPVFPSRGRILVVFPDLLVCSSTDSQEPRWSGFWCRLFFVVSPTEVVVSCTEVIRPRRDVRVQGGWDREVPGPGSLRTITQYALVDRVRDGPLAAGFMFSSKSQESGPCDS